MCPATLRNDCATSRIKIIVGRSSLPAHVSNEDDASSVPQFQKNHKLKHNKLDWSQ